MRYPLIPLLLATTLLVACGNDDKHPQYNQYNANPNPGYYDPTYDQPGYWEREDMTSLPACVSDVELRFRDVREACDNDSKFDRRYGRNDCRKYGDGFLSAYTSMNCRSPGPNPHRPRHFRISAERVRWMMERFYRQNDQGGFPNGPSFPQRPQGPGFPGNPPGPRPQQPGRPWIDPVDPSNGLPQPRPGIGQIPPRPQQPPFPRNAPYPNYPGNQPGNQLPNQPNHQGYPDYFQTQPWFGFSDSAPSGSARG